MKAIEFLEIQKKAQSSNSKQQNTSNKLQNELIS